VNLELSDEALAYGKEARRAIEAAGGDELTRRAEWEPDVRPHVIGPLLGEIGAWELAPRDDPDELEAAATLCRAAGYWGLAYPVAERLSRPAGLAVDGLVVGTRGAVAGLDLRWAAVSMVGSRNIATALGTSRPRTSAFVTDLDLRPVDENGAPDVALGLVLPCWTLLGMLDRAMALTREHVLVREQFGRPLAEFQGVRFQLTDAEVERAGVEVLAKYALWSAQSGLAEAVEDALTLRLAAVEAAEIVFRVAHQLHGATGFCDETTLSWLSRYSQPLRRLPFGRSATLDELTRALGRHGMTGLFGGGER
jgi:hypothetical protein